MYNKYLNHNYMKSPKLFLIVIISLLTFNVNAQFQANDNYKIQNEVSNLDSNSNSKKDSTYEFWFENTFNELSENEVSSEDDFYSDKITSSTSNFFEKLIGLNDPCTDGAIVGTPTVNDPDADGINNVCDLDDDNDGILDVNECADAISFLEDFGGDIPSGQRTDLASVSPGVTTVYGYAPIGGQVGDGSYAIVSNTT